MAIVRMTLEELKSRQVSKKEIEMARSIRDEDIDTADIPPPSENARVVSLPFEVKPVKQQITLRIDSDVLAWAKSKGESEKGYQTRINDMLRRLMMQELHAQ